MTIHTNELITPDRSGFRRIPLVRANTLVDGRNEVYRSGVRNSAQLTGVSATFGTLTADQEARGKYGSFNKLIVVSQSTESISIELDGLTARKWIIPSTGSFQIRSDEGLFFDWFILKNEGASTLDADKVSLTWAKVVEVRG